MRASVLCPLISGAMLFSVEIGPARVCADEFSWYDAVSGSFDDPKHWSAPEGTLFPAVLRNPNPNQRKPGSGDNVSFQRFDIDDSTRTGVAYEATVPGKTTVARLTAETNARVGTHQPLTIHIAESLTATSSSLELTTLKGGGTVVIGESLLGAVTVSGGTTAKLDVISRSSGIRIEDHSSLIAKSLNNDHIGLTLRGSSSVEAKSITLRGGSVRLPSPDIGENSAFTAETFEFMDGLMRLSSGSKLHLGQVKRRDPNFGSINIEVTNPGSEWILTTPIDSPGVRVSDRAYVNLGPEVTNPAVSATGAGSKLDLTKALGKGSIIANEGGQIAASEITLNGRVGVANKGALLTVAKSLTVNGNFSVESTEGGATNEAAFARITGDMTLSGLNSVASFKTFYLGDEPGFTTAVLQEKGRLHGRDDGTNWIGPVKGSNARMIIATGGEWNVPNASEIVVGKAGTGSVSMSDGKLLFGLRQNSAPPGQGTDNTACEPEPGPSAPETPKFVIAGEPDSKGTLTLTGPKALAEINGERFYIGDQGGEGTLELRNGAHLKVGTIVMTLGREKPAKGTLRLDGPGSVLEGIQTGRNMTGTKLEIGRHGEGLAEILNGAELNLPSLILGCFEESKGTVRVTGKSLDGTASRFESDGSITIGSNGRGFLEVLSGGQARSYNNAVIGRFESGEGLVTVRGADSQWIHTTEKNGSEPGTMVIGKGGKGTLVVADNALFEAGDLTLGEKPDADAKSKAEGTMVITNGATVRVKTGISFVTMGKEFGSKGTLVVHGANSKLLGVKDRNNGPGATLEIGLKGEGALVLSNNASMKLPSVILGSLERSSGSIQVATSSVFESDGSITVGAASTGRVEVASGGRLISHSDAVIGRDPKSDGKVTLTGQASRWVHASKPDLIDAGTITVGQKGTGEFQVEQGAICDTDNLVVGMNNGSEGTVSLFDPGTKLNVKGLSLGSQENSGLGTVTLFNGATINVGGSVLPRIITVLSPDNDASQLRINGHNSILNAPNVRILVGGSPAEGLPPNFSLESGGEANTGAASIGFGNGTATASVSDARWIIEEKDNPGFLIVGGVGKGELKIHEKGVVSVRGGDDKNPPRVELGRTEGTRVELDGSGARLETALLQAYGNSEMVISDAGVAEASRQIRINQANFHINAGELHAGSFTPLLNVSFQGVAIPFPILYRRPFVAVSGHNQASLIQLIVENQGVITVGRSLILQSSGNFSWAFDQKTGKIGRFPGLSPEYAGIRLTQGSIDIGEVPGAPEPGKVRVGQGGVLAGLGFIVGPAGTEVKSLGGDVVLLPWPGAIVLPSIPLPSTAATTSRTSSKPRLHSDEESEIPDLTGTLTVQGAVTLETNSTLHILVRGSTPIRDYGVLGATGAMRLGGDLVLHFDRGFAPVKGESFHFLNASAPPTGQFNAVKVSGLAPGFQYDLKWNANGIYTLTALNDGVATSPPALSIDPVANGLKVSWPSNLPGFTLQATTQLDSGEWINLPTVTNHWIADPLPPGQFFRLIQQ